MEIGSGRKLRCFQKILSAVLNLPRANPNPENAMPPELQPLTTHIFSRAGAADQPSNADLALYIS